MKVYHGSDLYIESIDLAKCKPNKDFGRGFYVTAIKKQAEEMAVRVAEWGNNTPVADDAVSVRINDYMEGIVSKKDFLEELKYKKKTHQICFCTLRSLQTLKQIDAKPDSAFYRIDDFIVQKIITENKITEKEATDLYYTSNTYSLLSDEASGLYLKSWTEIYEMLKNEINIKTNNI